MPDTSWPTGLDALLKAHFDTRYDARDDAAHLATYAPDATLVLGDRAIGRHEATEADVLAAWGQVGPREPHFSRPTLEAWHPHAVTAGVAVVGLHERHTDERLQAAVGVELAPTGWRVAWASLLDEPVRPYAAQRFVALAEMASLKAMAVAGPLTSLLESSWARRRWMPKQRILALPETHFSCMGTGDCCSHELTIGLDDNASRLVSAIDWPALIPDLPAGPYLEALPERAVGLVSFRHKLARDERGRCRFLSPQNRCTIHGLAGRAVFKPCHVFPMRFAWTPDGVCVTTNAMCPTARRGLGAPMAAQEPDLRARLAVADILRTERYYLRAGEAVPWETFRTVEGQLLELLKGPAPLKQKLWVALRWLSARLKDPEAGVDARWYDEAIKRQGFLQRLALRRFAAAFDPCFKDLQGVEPGEVSLPDVEDELTRFFRALLFSKVTTFPYGLVAGLNYLVLVHAVLERQVEKHAQKGISEAFWREFYAVVTSGTFFPVLGACHQTPATMFARVAGSPQFGLNMLRL